MARSELYVSFVGIFEFVGKKAAEAFMFLLFAGFFYKERCTASGRAVIERAAGIAQSLQKPIEQPSWKAADGDQRQRGVQLALLAELVRTSKVFRARVVFAVVYEQNVCQREKGGKRDGGRERVRDAATEFAEQRAYLLRI